MEWMEWMEWMEGTINVHVIKKLYLCSGFGNISDYFRIRIVMIQFPQAKVSVRNLNNL